jgi:hypothetical protein
MSAATPTIDGLDAWADRKVASARDEAARWLAKTADSHRATVEEEIVVSAYDGRRTLRIVYTAIPARWYDHLVMIFWTVPLDVRPGSRRREAVTYYKADDPKATRTALEIHCLRNFSLRDY